MGSTFHQLCPRYSGTLTPTAPAAMRLWESFTLLFFLILLKWKLSDTYGFYIAVMSPEDVNGKTNSAYPDQTAPLNSADPDQTAPLIRSSLIWICTICSDPSVAVFRICMVLSVKEQASMV